MKVPRPAGVPWRSSVGPVVIQRLRQLLVLGIFRGVVAVMVMGVEGVGVVAMGEGVVLVFVPLVMVAGVVVALVGLAIAVVGFDRGEEVWDGRRRKSLHCGSVMYGVG